MTIYQIDDAILGLFDPETGELMEGAEEMLAELQMERSEKVHNIALAYKNAVALEKAIREEEKRLAERRKACGVERLKNLLEYATGGEDFTFPDAAIKRKKNPASVAISDTEACVYWLEQAGHGDCVKRKPPEVSLTDVKNLLKCGIEVPGASLVQTARLEVK